MRMISLILMSAVVLFGLAGMIGGCADPDSGPSPYGSITATVVWPGQNDAGASDDLLGPSNWVVYGAREEKDSVTGTSRPSVQLFERSI